MKALIRKLGIAAALAGAVALVYLPVLHYGYFNFDDNVNVFENPRLYPVNGETFLCFWTRPYAGLYIPMTYTAWAGVAWLSRRVEGVGPQDCPPAAYFHGINLGLHLANAILVFLILRLLLSGIGAGAKNQSEEIRRDLAAGLGALFFALHPVQVETVVWITALKDLLSGFFFLCALWQYLLCRQGESLGRGRFAGATFFYLLAILAKPSAVILPLVAAVLDRGILRISGRKSFKTLIWWVVAALPVVILTKLIQPDSVIRAVPLLRWRFLVAADTLVFYLFRILWPLQLIIDYGRPPRYVLARPEAVLPLLGAVGLGLLFLFRKIRGVWATAIAMVLISILPVSGLIPFTFQNISTVKDRYLYLVLLGPSLAFALLLWRSRRRMIWSALTIVLILLASLSVKQRQWWQNSVLIYQRTIAVNPRSVFAHNNLANYLAKGGMINDAGVPYREDYPERPDLAHILPPEERSLLALDHYRRALALDPGYTDAHVNIAIEYTLRGDLEEARSHYEEALRQEPQHVDAQNNYGYVLGALGDFEEAIPHHLEALTLDPEFPKAHLNLANAFSALGQTEEAFFHYREALRLDPHYAKAHYNLALLHHLRGEVHEALAHYTAALWATPEFEEARHNRRVLLEEIAGPFEPRLISDGVESRH